MTNKEEISFDDFSKLDVRVGTIVSVEIVEGADRLLRIMVDVGEAEPRQIVSGIREYVENIEDLVGMQTTFIVNLESRIIRGLKSNGMLFAVGGEGEFEFLHPSNKVKPGTSVV